MKIKITTMENQMDKNVFRSDGIHLGFIKDDFLYSRDGVYMGWLDGNFVWDKKGFFRGTLKIMDGRHYILADKYTITPTQRTPRVSDDIPAPNPPPNAPPIALPTGVMDGFVNPRS